MVKILFFILDLLIKIGDGVKFFFKYFFKNSQRFLFYSRKWKFPRFNLQFSIYNLNSILNLKLNNLKKRLKSKKFSHFELISSVSEKVANFSSRLSNFKFQISNYLYRLRHSSQTVTLYSASRQVKLKWFILGIIFTVFFVLIPLLSYFWLLSLPDPRNLQTAEIPVTTKIFDRNGILLYEIYGNENRTPVKLSEIPTHLINATIAIEDQEFYIHPGFSMRGILRAIRETFLNHKLQGGSTLTQQLIRSVYLTPEPTFSRKLKELVLSFWAERLYSKDAILEMYFNQIPYGSTAWGAEAAAKLYFGKDVSRLSLAQAAYLAGLPSAPSIYSAYGTNPKAGLEQKNEVLKKMLELGFISKKEAEAGQKETLTFSAPKNNLKAPHFVMFVKSELEKKYGAKAVQMAGLRVITTLDLKTQEMAEKIVQSEVEKLKDLKVGNGAALITDPRTGEILSMVGSKNYWDPGLGNYNLAGASRQPGSAIKVVNYALALESGLTAASIIEDAPVNFQIAGQPNYSPVNYDGRFHGKITLRGALANSYNIPAVKVLAKLGVANMIKKGREMGIENWSDPRGYGLSLTLGGGEVTMLDMASVYGVLANLGKKSELTPILKITDYRGRLLEEKQKGSEETVVDPGTAFIINDILADDAARSWAFGSHSLLEIPKRTVSVKTGTTNNLRDNWAIGYTPSYVVVTWVGNNDGSPMSGIASGITGATPIWHKIMENLLKNKKDEPFSPPENIIQADACGKKEYFLKGTESSVVCPLPSPTPTPTP